MGDSKSSSDGSGKVDDNSGSDNEPLETGCGESMHSTPHLNQMAYTKAKASVHLKVHFLMTHFNIILPSTFHSFTSFLSHMSTSSDRPNQFPDHY